RSCYGVNTTLCLWLFLVYETCGFRNMKILYIANEISRKNGWAVINYYTAREMARLGHEVHVVTANKAVNENIDRVKQYSLLTSFADGYLKPVRVTCDAIRVKKLFHAAGVFDIVHVLVEPYLPLLPFVNGRKKIFSIVGTYAVFPFQQGFNKYFYRMALKSAERIIAISHYTAERFAENNHAKRPVQVVPLGVDVERFGGDTVEAEIKENAFCFVGHLKPRKGLLYAIKAIERLMSESPSVKLYVIGEDDFKEYAQKCKTYVQKHGLINNVIFLGFLPQHEITKYYRRCLANVLPSVNEGNYFEGFGLIHLEANAAGIPTIGSRACGNESAIVHGETGFLCRQRDVDDLYKKMKLILAIKNTPSYAIMCQRCREHALQNDWQVYARKLNDCYLGNITRFQSSQ
ncbi:MAG: glycosyltransferase family 4 protein, partial [Clostridia bacterium]|nr:glycosyltransferase family 4 protein [Clostridia bacterium]